MQKSEEAQATSRPFELMDMTASESLQDASKSRNFLLERCDICDNSISLDVGDVIEGDTWYHRSCLNRLEGLDRQNRERNSDVFGKTS